MNFEQTYDTDYLRGGISMYNKSAGLMVGAAGEYVPTGAYGALGYYNGNEPLAGYFEGNVNVTGNITSGTGTVFIDGTNSRVGIGVKNPVAKLDIGDAMITTPKGDTSILLTHDDGDAYLETSSTDASEGVLFWGAGSGEAGLIYHLFGSGYTNGWVSGLHVFINESGSPIMFDTANTERMRITSGGNVGIGTTSPDSLLSVGGVGKENATIYAYNDDSGFFSYGTYAEATGSSTFGIAQFGNASNAAFNIGGMFVGSKPIDSGGVVGVYGIADPQVTTSNTARGGFFEAHGTSGTSAVYGVDIISQGADPSGSVYGLQAHADASSGTVGSSFGVYGTASDATTNIGGAFYATNTGGTDSRAVYGVASGATTNYGGMFIATSGTGTRYGVHSAGATYDFYAAGVGTNYGPFTGGHEVILDPSIADSVKKGMVVSVTGETKRRVENGSVDISSTLPTVTLASKPQDKAVFGAFVQEYSIPGDHWYNSSDERFGTVNALGEGRVFTTNINGEVGVGDYLTTSEIPGYGMRQDDDLLHSYTLAKVTETPDWDSITDFIEHDGKQYKVYLIGVVYTSG